MQMTLFEKQQFVNEHFKRSALYQMGDMPDDHTDVFIGNAVYAASAFMLKYKGKGKQIEDYANAIAMDWLEGLEKQWREKNK